MHAHTHVHTYTDTHTETSTNAHIYAYTCTLTSRHTCMHAQCTYMHVCKTCGIKWSGAIRPKQGLLLCDCFPIDF